MFETLGQTRCVGLNLDATTAQLATDCDSVAVEYRTIDLPCESKLPTPNNQLYLTAITRLPKALLKVA